MNARYVNGVLKERRARLSLSQLRRHNAQSYNFARFMWA